DITFGDSNRTKATTEPNNILIAYLTRSFSASSDVALEVVDIASAEGTASIIASARSEMKDDVQFRAGTRPQLTIPDLRANSLYSMSISSRHTSLEQPEETLHLADQARQALHQYTVSTTAQDPHGSGTPE
ncbi:trophoblast glycoprotein, partial [Striga asiatica]